MRKVLFSLVALSMHIIVYAQPTAYSKYEADSLQALLPSLKEDNIKVNCLNRLSSMYITSDSKLALDYAMQSIALSRKINFHKGLAKSLANAAFIHAVASEWPKSIAELNEAMQIVESDEDVVTLWTIMSINYFTRGEPNESLKWTRKVLSHPKFLSAPEISHWAPYMQMGRAYEQLDNLDSAKKYAALQIDLVKKYAHVIPDLASNSYSLFGYIAIKEERNEDALKNYRSAKNFHGISRVYNKTGQKDSAIYYAKLGLKHGQAVNAEAEIQEAALYLAKSFETKFPTEGYYYLKIYVDSKDRQFNNTKLKQLEQIKLEEQRTNFELEKQLTKQQNRFILMALSIGLSVFLFFTFLLYRSNKRKGIANANLENTLATLKSTQSQLIQSEKMASLGELTAGIAHEIQNPLNFVNNFSEVNKELIKEIQDIRRKTQDGKQLSDEDEILNDIADNSEKINHHGKRAGEIVKSMLQHSRKSGNQKELTDINALCDEYLRLAYHGYRAKDKSFNAEFKTEFDSTLPKLNIIPQDIGRVVLNLINNAFYAVNQQRTTNNEQPLVIVSTKNLGDRIEISVKDNGPGIPDSIKEKIFQPFFTTKPTGQGTGLGLSLSYDIVKAHGGELKVATKEGEGSEFIVQLPLNL